MNIYIYIYLRVTVSYQTHMRIDLEFRIWNQNKSNIISNEYKLTHTKKRLNVV